MATTTPNFGWSVPTSTDLVKDGATAIETLGDAIDASLVDLKGGTSGQVLAKNSNTDMDFTWTAVDPLVILDAKGDLISATAADTPARLAVGTNAQVLTADSTASTGLAWKQQGMTFITRTTFSNVASQTFDNVFTSTYTAYKVVLENMAAVTNTDSLYLQFRYGTTTQTSGYYGANFLLNYAPTAVNTGMSNANQITLLTRTGDTNNNQGQLELLITKVGVSSKPHLSGAGFNSTDGGPVLVGGKQETNVQTYTGFLLKSSSTNIYGTVTIYGMGNA
jgi:hypothetical protein